MQNLDLVILAGGKGTRIKRLSNGKPKPLIKLNKKPFIYYILNHFCKFNFRKIYILAGFKGKIIKKLLNKKTFNLTKIEVVVEKKPMDTAGALYSLKKKINTDFVLLNGDSILKLKKIHSLKKNTMFLTNNSIYRSNLKLNNLKINKNKNLIISKYSNLMNGGVYYFKKKFLNLIENKKRSLEKDLIPKLIKDKNIQGAIVNDFFLDIGTPKNLKKAPKFLHENFYKPAVFLDRDGVLNYDNGYTNKFKDFKFKTNVLKALKFCIKKNYYIFIVTNQAGIAKGYYKVEDFINLHRKINTFLSKKDIYIDDVKFCPFHPKGKIKKFRKRSNFRKPGNSMILEIFKTWNINKSKSFMIGDKKTDLLAAKKSNIYFEFDKDNLYKQVSKIIKNKKIK